MLCNYGEFFPYAGALRPSGEVVSIGGYDGREHPPSKDVIDLLAKGLCEGATRGEYVATALVYDVRVMPPSGSEVTDAIAAELEHKDGYSATVFFPYELTNGPPVLASPFAAADSRSTRARASSRANGRNESKAAISSGVARIVIPALSRDLPLLQRQSRKCEVFRKVAPSRIAVMDEIVFPRSGPTPDA